MRLTEFVGAAGVLLVTLGVGTVAHELAHAIVLRALGIGYDIEWLPDRNASPFLGVGVHRAWATVSPRSIPPGTSPWGLRVAAIAPLVLATPPLLVLVGVLPDPVESDNVFLAAASVAWFGCALPSPRDFSLFWHADQVIDDHRRTSLNR